MSRLRPSGVFIVCTLLTACNNPASPSTAGPSVVGQWAGTTLQGMPISFTVSPDERLTTITIGYSFNGCSGSETFSGLDIPTAPNVTCIPGPCSGTIASYRAFGYATPRAADARQIAVNGLFLPGNRAEGQASFSNFAGCGSANGVAWTATRR